MDSKIESFIWRKEASFGRGDGIAEVPISQQTDQVLLLTEEKNHQYIELLQNFTQQMKRWKSVMLSPEYLLQSKRNDYGGIDKPGV